MPNKHAAGAAIGLAIVCGAVDAQEPLSAIDWLRRNPPQASVYRYAPVAEPPVTSGVHAPEVTVTPLDASPLAMGLVPATVTGLPLTLWQGSTTPTLTRLIAQAPVNRSPAMQSVLYTLLLAEAQAPKDSAQSPELTLAMIDRLLDLGAVEPAQALTRKVGPTRTKDLFQRYFDTALLTGSENSACATLSGAPYLAPGYAARIYCSARRGDWPAAALMLDTAATLGDLSDTEAALLEIFLHGDFDGLTPPPAPPKPVDPLSFRMFEAIGEPLTTQSLPRAFAHADLRDIAGWKAQVEAAERLAQTGALSANRFLGIYTERRPAASGGVWDRVAALQDFDAAMATENPDRIAETLPSAWQAMRAARIEVTFATLYADQLAAHPPSGTAEQHLAWQIRLLSDQYETAARDAPDTAQADFLAGIALGTPTALPGASDLERAIADGFGPDAQMPRLLSDLRDRGSLGELILRAITLFRQGMDGNPKALTDALASLRQVGLEDTARRAALQLALLEPRS